jgi:hypothetical protein
MMHVGRGARYGSVGAAIALLLLAALVPCLAHMEGSGSGDLCLSFGPPTGPGVVHQLIPAGYSAPPLGAVYRVVPADLPVPPPEA